MADAYRVSRVSREAFLRLARELTCSAYAITNSIVRTNSGFESRALGHLDSACARLVALAPLLDPREQEFNGPVIDRITAHLNKAIEKVRASTQARIANRREEKLRSALRSLKKVDDLLDEIWLYLPHVSLDTP